MRGSFMRRKVNPPGAWRKIRLARMSKGKSRGNGDIFLICTICSVEKRSIFAESKKELNYVII